MTLPFENNTTQVVKRLAKRSLSSEKRRNVLLVITIALAAFLMSTVGTAIFSTGAMQRKMAEDTYEIVYSLITEEDLQNLRQKSNGPDCNTLWGRTTTTTPAGWFRCPMGTKIPFMPHGNSRRFWREPTLKQ